MWRFSESLFIVSIMVVSTRVSADELAGISMPEQVTVDGHDLVLNGMGLREATFLKVNVYVAGLYLQQRSSDAEQILDSPQWMRLRMVFVRDVSESDIAKAWREGFEKNAEEPLSVYQERLDRLISWMLPMSKGDTMTFTATPDKGVEVDVNGERKGLIPGDDFTQGFFRIWIGPKPPNAGLKKGLLGVN